MWPAIVMVHIVCLSVCHMRISVKLSEIDVWLLGNTKRNPCSLIQNLPLDLRLKVLFHHFWCFSVAFSDKLYTVAPIRAARHWEKPRHGEIQLGVSGSDFAQNIKELYFLPRIGEQILKLGTPGDHCKMYTVVTQVGLSQNVVAQGP